MRRVPSSFVLIFVLLLPLRGQTPADPAAKPVNPTQAPVAGDLTKLPGDTLTLTEARAFLKDHKDERAKVEEARKVVLKQGAKATPEQRARLIEAFRAAQRERLQKLQAQAPRVRDLQQKIEQAEKVSPPATKPTT